MPPTFSKIFFAVFCLSSILQGMYSTYFVSILTTIERVYQIQSKTAGAMLSASEIGQIIGSLLIAYHGGRGNKPRWIAACMAIMAVAALISTSPHFLTAIYHQPKSNSIQMPYQHQTNDLNLESSSSSSAPASATTNASDTPLPQLTRKAQTCYVEQFAGLKVLNSTLEIPLDSSESVSSSNQISLIFVIFSACLLVIGFGSTAITTLGIPFIDDIVSKEDSPFYLGLSIGLKILGPALGFLLGSFCMGLDMNLITWTSVFDDGDTAQGNPVSLISHGAHQGAWWLGPIMISIPLLILAIPMYYLSLYSIGSCNQSENFGDITYQAAEDHDLGGSSDFQAHVLAIGDLDVTSDQTRYSDVADSSSREALQVKGSPELCYNYSHNIVLNKPVLGRKNILCYQKQVACSGTAGDSGDNTTNGNTNNHNSNNNNNGNNGGSSTFPSNNNDSGGWARSCVIVKHLSSLETTSYAKRDANDEEAKSLHAGSKSSSLCSTSLSVPQCKHSGSTTTSAATSADILGLMSRLMENRLLLLRMLSSVLHLLPIAGFYTFLPKYLMEQFRMAASSASAISGLAGVFFVGIGAFSGGTIIRLLNINSRLITRWIAMSALLYALGMLILMQLGCPQNKTITVRSERFTSSNCLDTCNCGDRDYSPVCLNGTTYMSPCLAGCKSSRLAADRKWIYEDCGCHRSSANESDSSDVVVATTKASHSIATENLNFVAVQGSCLLDCDNLYWYIIVFSTVTLLHSSSEVGAMMFNLRCVRQSDRALALGLVTFACSLFGSIPCSIVYGSIIDLTCIHWDKVAPSYQQQQQHNLNFDLNSKQEIPEPASAISKGACLAYENDLFRIYLHGATAFVMLLAFFVDLIICSKSHKVDFYDDDNSSLGNDDAKSTTSGMKLPHAIEDNSHHNKSTETI